MHLVGIALLLSWCCNGGQRAGDNDLNTPKAKQHGEGQGGKFCSAQNVPKGQGKILVIAPCDQAHPATSMSCTPRNRAKATLMNKTAFERTIGPHPTKSSEAETCSKTTRMAYFVQK